MELDQGVNVLFGPNGAGKTTLVESLYVLCTTRSYRATKLEHLIRSPYTQGSIEAETSEFETLRVDIEPGKTKLIKNGNRASKASQFLHKNRIVILAPEHLELISGSGEKRRQFMDHLLCQKDPAQLDLLKNYRKTIKQKQALLKQNLPLKTYEDLVQPWNQQLVSLGQEVRAKRKNLLEKIGPIFFDEYQNFKNEEVSLTYLEKENDMEEKLKDFLMIEHKAKRTLVGPHRDDLQINLNQKSANAVASQGERASILLSLKLSEMDYLTDDSLPTLLLDDVGVTLDHDRREALWKRIETLKPQTVITTPDRSIVDSLEGIGKHVPIQR